MSHDAEKHWAALESVPMDDDTPYTQPPPALIDFEIAPSSNILQYIDRAGFGTDHFGAEIEAMGEVEKMVEVGRRCVHMLYTYRSVSKAIPMVAGSDEASKRSIHEATYRVLRPEISKIHDVMIYVTNAIDVFTRHLRSAQSKRIVPEGLFDAMLSAVDVLQQLDKLKDMKACLTNDFSRFKRSAQFMMSMLPQEEAAQVENEVKALHLFLASPEYPRRYVMGILKRKCRIHPNFEDVMLELLQRAIDVLTAEAYLLPEEKHTILRAIPHVIVLMDGDDSSETSFNAFKQKKVKMSAVQRFMQRYPVVPEFGDMVARISHTIVEAPHFDMDTMESAYGISADSKIQSEYSLVAHWPAIKMEYDSYTARLASILNVSSDRGTQKNLETMNWASNVVLALTEGLSLLRRWNCTLREAFAWKIAHPCDAAESMSADPSSLYARALKLNLDRTEIRAVVEVISMIKSLAGYIEKNEELLAPYIRMHIHQITQQLVQGALVPVLHRADKKKRGIMADLLALRAMAADYGGKMESLDNFKRYKRAQGAVTASVSPRVVGPSATQLQLLRTMIRAFYDDSSELRQGSGMLNREDLKREDIDALRSFYEASFAFPYLLNLGITLKSLSNLGDLWFREYHLEITKCIQFPIDISFPWVLTQFIIMPSQFSGAEPTAAGKKKAKKNKSKMWAGSGRDLIAQVLYTLDLYNDAAQTALYDLNCQYLFNEIQAEVNLAYDQLMFHLQGEIYSYYKDWAASTELDKMWKREVEGKERKGWGWYTPQRWRSQVQIQQRHLLLMGRSIDLNKRLSMGMNVKVREDVELAMKIFESQSLYGIIEFEATIRTIEHAVNLMRADGLGMDSWESIFGEISEAVSASSIRGRVSTHVLTCLLLDLLPNFRFCNSTQRFVRAPAQLKPFEFPTRPVNLDNTMAKGAMCSKAFEQIETGLRDFVGTQHFECMTRLLSCAELPLVIEGVTHQSELKLAEIKGVTDQLAPGLPPISLPPYHEGMVGCCVTFERYLAELLSYGDLKSTLFQDLTELGNALAFLHALSRILESERCLQFIHSVPIIGMASAKNYEREHTRAMAAMSTMGQIVKGSDREQTLLKTASTAQDLAASLSSTQRLITSVLRRLDKALDQRNLRSNWEDDSPANGVLEVEETVQFHRIFSALNFIYCMYDGEDDSSQFGDGFALAGVTIMNLLDQHEMFDLLDFSYHVLNVHGYERAIPSDSLSQRATTPFSAEQQSRARLFLPTAYHMRCLHFEYFNLTRAAYPGRGGKNEQVVVFHPPHDDVSLVFSSPRSYIDSYITTPVSHGRYPSQESAALHPRAERLSSSGVLGNTTDQESITANLGQRKSSLQDSSLLIAQDDGLGMMSTGMMSTFGSRLSTPGKIETPFGGDGGSTPISGGISPHIMSRAPPSSDAKRRKHPKVQKLCEMGFDEESSMKALQQSGGNIESAVDILTEQLRSPPRQSQQRSAQKTSTDIPLDILTPSNDITGAVFQIPKKSSPPPSGVSDMISSLEPSEVAQFDSQTFARQQQQQLNVGVVNPSPAGYEGNSPMISSVEGRKSLNQSRALMPEINTTAQSIATASRGENLLMRLPGSENLSLASHAGDVQRNSAENSTVLIPSQQSRGNQSISFPRGPTTPNSLSQGSPMQPHGPSVVTNSTVNPMSSVPLKQRPAKPTGRAPVGGTSGARVDVTNPAQASPGMHTPPKTMNQAPENRFSKPVGAPQQFMPQSLAMQPILGPQGTAANNMNQQWWPQQQPHPAPPRQMQGGFVPQMMVPQGPWPSGPGQMPRPMSLPYGQAGQVPRPQMPPPQWSTNNPGIAGHPGMYQMQGGQQPLLGAGIHQQNLGQHNFQQGRPPAPMNQMQPPQQMMNPASAISAMGMTQPPRGNQGPRGPNNSPPHFLPPNRPSR